MDTAVAFIASSNNKYSIAALAGALESAPATRNAPLYFLSSRDAGLISALRGLAERHERVLVCFSFATTNIVAVHALLTQLRAELPHDTVTYCAGGPHPSGDPEGALALGFDVVAIGEGEETFPELVATVASGGDIAGIKGIAFVRDGAVVKTGRRRPVDLDAYPPFSLQHNKLAPIEISRGCPHACRFCQTSYLFGARMRHRGIGQVVRYIELSKANGTRDFRFISPNALAYGSDDGATVNLEAVESLLKEASKITGTEHLFFGSFPSEVRPEAVSAEALELITSYTGTKMLVVGAQTGSQRMLDLLHREHAVADIYRAVELILAAGLEVSVDFIFGLPDKTEEDRRLSIAMMDALATKGARIHSHTFIPLPGTPLARCAAGVVDPELAVYLSRLANRGQQFGQWKKQQEMARRASELQRSIKA